MSIGCGLCRCCRERGDAIYCSVVEQVIGGLVAMAFGAWLFWMLSP